MVIDGYPDLDADIGDSDVLHTGPLPVLSVEDMESSAHLGSSIDHGWNNREFTGSKFLGGFGETVLYNLDYWTLRNRSSQLFTENLYARGIIFRLITNEINSGLVPDSAPDEVVLDQSEETLTDWSETVENLFRLWGRSTQVCDWKGESTFGGLQRAARMEALISGDVLVVLRPSRKFGLPQVQLVSGNQIQTPLMTEFKPRAGNTILHGVERDKTHRVVAYWVRQEDNKFKRLSAFGEQSGRKIAWLVFGNETRLDDVRGMPLLAVILQSLKDVDRYRDASQRKAVINSILAVFVKKTEDKMGSLPFTGGAAARTTVETATPGADPRPYNIESHVPGLIMQELQTGEEPVGFHNQGIDEKFGDFESSITQAIAWALEIPPEILRLSFSNNYSASQAAINEFKIYLQKVWTVWGETFCAPIYQEWLINQTLLGRIETPGFLEAWRDPKQHDVFAAWSLADWYGSVKPSTDMLKQAKGSQLVVSEGWSTNQKEARGITGTDFRSNIKKLTRENELKVKAARPLAEFRAEFGDQEADSAIEAVEDTVLRVLEDVEINA